MGEREFEKAFSENRGGEKAREEAAQDHDYRTLLQRLDPATRDWLERLAAKGPATASDVEHAKHEAQVQHVKEAEEATLRFSGFFVLALCLPLWILHLARRRSTTHRERFPNSEFGPEIILTVGGFLASLAAVFGAWLSVWAFR